MSKFEPKQGVACRDCKWCETDIVRASNPPMYRCKKLNTYVYCGQTICEEDVPKDKPSNRFPWEDRCIVNDYEPPKVNDYEPSKVNNFEPINGHSYNWEHKSGEGWSSHTLVDDTIAEQKEYPTFEAEQKEIKEALRKMLNEGLKTPDVETRLEALEKKVDEHYGTSKALEEILGTPKPTTQSLTLNVRKMEMDNAHYYVVLGEHRDSLEALEKRIEELEKRLRNY